MAKKGVFIRMDKKLREELNSMSKRLGKSKSDVIRDALELLTRKRNLKTPKMKGVISGIKLGELEEISDELKGVW
ncbi:MAG: ribbon-helix-helix protein, CopG family [Candidatus Njordarchaeia archaeon]